MTEAERAAAAAGLIEAERSGTPTDAISIRYPDATVEDAYGIAMGVAEAKVATGRQIVGHKVGLTSPAMQRLAGVTEPDFGLIYDDWIAPEGTLIDVSALTRPFVEAEVAFVLEHDLDREAVTPVDVLRATAFVLPAVEIVASRYRAWGPNLVLDSIADAASCGRVVLGGNPADPRIVDVRNIGATLARNGVVEESGVAAAVMGNPLNAVAWLANKLQEFELYPAAGDVVLSGSFTTAIPLQGGDTIVASFGPLGIVMFGT